MFAISPLVVLIVALTSAIATKTTSQTEAESEAVKAATTQCKMVPGSARQTGAVGQDGTLPQPTRACQAGFEHPVPETGK